MLSGIGPANHLNSLGIPVLANLSVGDNLQDHSTKNVLSAIHDIGKANVECSRLAHLTNHSGPFTIPGTCEAVAWVKTKLR